MILQKNYLDILATFSTLVSEIGIKCIQYTKPITFDVAKWDQNHKTDKLWKHSLYQNANSKNEYWWWSSEVSILKRCIQIDRVHPDVFASDLYDNLKSIISVSEESSNSLMYALWKLEYFLSSNGKQFSTDLFNFSENHKVPWKQIWSFYYW